MTPDRALAGVESFKAAPTGLIVIVLLGVGIYFLAKSMARHLRRVPLSFDEVRPAGDPTPGARPDGPRVGHPPDPDSPDPAHSG